VPKVVSADTSPTDRIDDRIDFRVDPDAEPADWDEALAAFLLRYVRSQAARSAGAAAEVRTKGKSA